MTMLEEAVGSRVRRLRKAQSWTAELLAAVIGIAPATISRIERGQVSCTVRTLGRLAAGLGVSVGALFEDSEPESVSAASISPRIRGIAIRLAEQSDEVLFRASACFGRAPPFC